MNQGANGTMVLPTALQVMGNLCSLLLNVTFANGVEARMNQM